MNYYNIEGGRGGTGTEIKIQFKDDILFLLKTSSESNVLWHFILSLQ